MKDLMAFGIIDEYVDNTKDTTAPFGELSDFSRSYSKDKGILSGNGVEAVIFDVIEDGAEVPLDEESGNDVLRLISWVGTELRNGTVGNDKAAFQERVLEVHLEYGFTNVIVGAIVLSDGLHGPNYIQFDAHDNRYKVWFRDDAFREQYPHFTIDVIMPIDNIDNLMRPKSEIEQHILGPVEITQRATSMRQDEVPTSFGLQEHMWHEFNNETQTVNTFWGINLYGQEAFSVDEQKKAIAEAILSHSIYDRARWSKVLPSIFTPHELYVLPAWDEVAIKNRTLNGGIYSPTLLVNKQLEVGHTFAVGYEEPHVTEHLTMGTVLHKSLSFVSVGSPTNLEDKYQFDDFVPTYALIHAHHLDYNRMDTKDREFMRRLLSVIREAEVYVRGNVLPDGVSRVTRNNYDYLTYSVSDLSILVLTKGSYFEHYELEFEADPIVIPDLPDNGVTIGSVDILNHDISASGIARVSGETSDVVTGTTILATFDDGRNPEVAVTASANEQGLFSFTGVDISHLDYGTIEFTVAVDDKFGNRLSDTAIHNYLSRDGSFEPLAITVVDGKATVTTVARNVPAGTPVSIYLEDRLGARLSRQTTVLSDGEVEVVIVLRDGVTNLAYGALVGKATAMDTLGRSFDVTGTANFVGPDGIISDFTVAINSAERTLTATANTQNIEIGADISMSILDSVGGIMEVTTTVQDDASVIFENISLEATTIIGYGELRLRMYGVGYSGRVIEAVTTGEYTEPSPEPVVELADIVTDANGDYVFTGTVTNLETNEHVDLSLVDSAGTEVKVVMNLTGGAFNTTVPNDELSSLLEGAVNATVIYTADSLSIYSDSGTFEHSVPVVEPTITLNAETKVGDNGYTIDGTVTNPGLNSVVNISFADEDFTTIDVQAPIAADGSYSHTEADIIAGGLKAGVITVSAYVLDSTEGQVSKSISFTHTVPVVEPEMAITIDVFDVYNNIGVDVEATITNYGDLETVDLTVTDSAGNVHTDTKYINEPGGIIYASVYNLPDLGLVPGTINVKLSTLTLAEEEISAERDFNYIPEEPEEPSEPPTITVAPFAQVSGDEHEITGTVSNYGNARQVALFVKDIDGKDTVYTPPIDTSNDTFVHNIPLFADAGLASGPIETTAIVETGELEARAVSVGDYNPLGETRVPMVSIRDVQELAEGDYKVRGRVEYKGSHNTTDLKLTDSHGHELDTRVTLETNGQFEVDITGIEAQGIKEGDLEFVASITHGYDTYNSRPYKVVYDKGNDGNIPAKPDITITNVRPLEGGIYAISLKSNKLARYELMEFVFTDGTGEVTRVYDRYISNASWITYGGAWDYIWGVNQGTLLVKAKDFEGNEITSDLALVDFYENDVPPNEPELAISMDTAEITDEGDLNVTYTAGNGVRDIELVAIDENRNRHEVSVSGGTGSITGLLDKGIAEGITTVYVTGRTGTYGQTSSVWQYLEHNIVREHDGEPVSEHVNLLAVAEWEDGSLQMLFNTPNSADGAIINVALYGEDGSGETAAQGTVHNGRGLVLADSSALTSIGEGHIYFRGYVEINGNWEPSNAEYFERGNWQGYPVDPIGNRAYSAIDVDNPDFVEFTNTAVAGKNFTAQVALHEALNGTSISVQIDDINGNRTSKYVTVENGSATIDVDAADTIRKVDVGCGLGMFITRYIFER